MNRRQLLQLGIGAALGGASARLGATDVLTATDVHPANYPTVEAVRWMGERLAEETGGELGIRLYHSGQLGRESEAIGLARHAALDIVRVYSGALNNAFPLTRALCLPYTFSSTLHLRRVLDGELGARVLEGFSRRDLVGLAIYDCGERCFYNTLRPIHTPSDLRGMKVRVPPSDIFLELVRRFGANPTPLAYGAVYSALETGLIEGAENNIRSFHASRHFEAAPLWSLSRHSHAPDLLLMSRQRFERLSRRQQALVIGLARESVTVMRRRWDEGEQQAREALDAAGVVSNEVDLVAFRSAARPLVDAYAGQAEIAALLAMIRREESA